MSRFNDDDIVYRNLETDEDENWYNDEDHDETDEENMEYDWLNIDDEEEDDEDENEEEDLEDEWGDIDEDDEDED
ncbi:MAG: hypothetical protein ACW99G_00450 [Candidatus Thorarchaeota archaeon]|jgi:segregation and condensation protein B